VKCPKCFAASTLKDIACSNCGNKSLKFSAAKTPECSKCEIKGQKLPCPKCGCDLTQLLLK
jgi:ribosomal protein S27E